MPVHLSTFHLPSGARCLREDCIGDITLEDARSVLEQAGPGGPFYGLPVLGLTEQMTSVSAEARSLFGGSADVSAVWAAVVVTKPVIRVTINFLMRFNKSWKLRLFAREDEAVRWLDEQVRGGAAGKETR
jgi:hypothetical protein